MNEFYIERELRWFQEGDLVQHMKNAEDYASKDELEPPDGEELNLVTSQIKGSEYHAPCIDIDMPCVLVDSKTPGHHHLYIEKPVKWESYVKLLEAMVECGIVEEGYYKASVAKGYTGCRRAPLVRNVKNLREAILREGRLFDLEIEDVQIADQHPRFSLEEIRAATVAPDLQPEPPF